MRAALAEAALAAGEGERRTARSPSSTRRWWRAAASRVRASGDPTAHAVMVALREAARRLGRRSLPGLTVFCAVEPCAMCAGALLQADVDDGRVRAGRPARGRLRLGRPAGRRARPAAPAPGRVGHPPGRRRRPAPRPRRPGRRAAEAEPPPAPVREGRVERLCYPRPRRGVRVVDGAALEKRCAKAPWVRIPPSPPSASAATSGHPVAPALGRGRATHGSPERSPRGLGRRTGNAVWGNPSWVRIPPLRQPAADAGLSWAGRARRGTSGALYLQSAPAGLNPLPRPAFADADGAIGVEDRVPRSGDA